MPGSEFASVPVVDMGPLLRADGANDPRFLQTCQAIDAACRHVGFFYVTNHGVPDELLLRLEAVSRAFFLQPEEEKRRISMSKGGRAWRGYFPLGDELTSGKPDQKSGIYFGQELPESHRLVVAKTPMHGQNLFPNDEMRTAVLEYMKAMESLGHAVMSGISMGLGFPSAHFSHSITCDPLCLFRVFCYPPDPLADTMGRFGVGEHTDYGLLTLLAMTDSGLQIKNQNNEWIDAPLVPGAFVVNIGDMLEAMTMGLYRSTPHRVRTSAVQRDRLSFPFFFDPSWEAPIGILPLTEQQKEDARHAVARAAASGYRRWDSAALSLLVSPGCRYGDYLLRKVGKVFPELAEACNLQTAPGSLPVDPSIG